MKISKNFIEISHIDDQRHETSRRKIGDAIFQKSFEKNHILPIYHGQSLKKSAIMHKC